MMLKLIFVMLIAACSLIWLMYTYKRQEWGAHYAFIAASCAIVMGFDWFSTGITIPTSLANFENSINLIYIVLGIGALYVMHRTEKIKEF
jgi:hypothetical protein